MSYTNKQKQITMENLKHRLWDERGYDYAYLNKLTSKKLKSLYDTEFFYE